jgi:PLP dependent protein
VAGRVAEVRQRIADAGGSERVVVIAMAKDVPAPMVDAAMAAGITDVGHNYAQELVSMAAEIGSQPRWHFAGRLQTNKVRAIGAVVGLWQSVDRPSIVDELTRRVPAADLLVQVDVAGVAGQGGCPPDDVAGLVARATDAGLGVQGLMCIGARGSEAAIRAGFRRVRRLADELGLADCSMGMTDDLQVAVQEGSTMVRVGRAIFGERPLRPPDRSLTS